MLQGVYVGRKGGKRVLARGDMKEEGCWRGYEEGGEKEVSYKRGHLGDYKRQDPEGT